MRVYICGVRGSTPASGLEFCRYGGHTTSIAIGDADGPPRLIIDAGTGIRQVTDLLRGQPFRGSILLSHLHWDHLQGLPFFSAGDRPDARVDVYVPQQPGAAADNLADMMAPPHFPITPADLHGQWTFTHIAEGTREIDGFVVTAREIPHKGGRTFGYRVENGSGAAVYLSDHSSIELGAGPAGFGPYHEAALTLADRADLLIHDAQYVEEEWPMRSHFGHSTDSYAIGLAKEAGVRRLLMFHHEPTRTDDTLDAMAAEWAKEEAVEVMPAREGTMFDVPDGVLAPGSLQPAGAARLARRPSRVCDEGGNAGLRRRVGIHPSHRAPGEEGQSRQSPPSV